MRKDLLASLIYGGFGIWSYVWHSSWWWCPNYSPGFCWTQCVWVNVRIELWAPFRREKPSTLMFSRMMQPGSAAVTADLHRAPGCLWPPEALAIPLMVATYFWQVSSGYSKLWEGILVLTPPAAPSSHLKSFTLCWDQEILKRKPWVRDQFRGLK